MLNKRFLALAGCLLALAGSTYPAGAHAANCIDVAIPKQVVEARHGEWIELTPEQWQFLRGVYAMNPLTPPGLPYGDKAVLARLQGDADGVVFFIDGDRACTPMEAPPALLALMDDVAAAKIAHEGAGL
jgi:hypothetical protein